MQKEHDDGGMSYEQFQSLPSNERTKLDNRVRQWAHRSREHLPKKHFLFCLVLSHLLRNAHTYFNIPNPTDLQLKLFEEKCISDSTKHEFVAEFKEVNKRIREVCEMKQKRRVIDQKRLVSELRDDYGTYKNIAQISGIFPESQ